MGELVKFPALYRAAADSTDRVIDASNRFIAQQLGLIPIRRSPPGYVPLAGRGAGDGEVTFEMQLED